MEGEDGGGCRGAAGGRLLTPCQEREPLALCPSGILASQPRIGISDVGQGQTTLGFMIEAPLDRGKWRKEVKKEGRGVAGLRGELTRKIWHLARLPHAFCRLPPFLSYVPVYLPLLSPR